MKASIGRFPEDFMFQLTVVEYLNLRFQFGTSSLRYQFGTAKRRYLPYAFTEHGALMAATVLNSQRAVDMSLAIIRTFIKLRNILMEHKELKKKLDELEKKYDKNFLVVFQAIKKLMEPPPKPKLEPEKPKGPFGFTA